jgi:hypothetical protein
MASLLSDLTYNQGSELLARLGRAGLTTEQAKRLLADPELVTQWVKTLPVTTKLTRERPIFRVTVNYDLPFEQMVAAGKYQWVSEDIKASRKADPADHFQLTGTGQQEIDIVLLHLNRDATTEEVLVEMRQQGLRPATIEELLVLGAVHAQLQEQFPVVALGSRCLLVGSVYVPVLFNKDYGRTLGLGFYRGGWGGDHRFAAVRK